MKVGMFGFEGHAGKIAKLVMRKHEVRVMYGKDENLKKAKEMELEGCKLFESR